jgi:hypothetical protein
MGEFVNPLPVKVIGNAVACAIVLLNLYLLEQSLGWIWTAVLAGGIGGGCVLCSAWKIRGPSRKCAHIWEESGFRVEGS